MRYSLIFLWNEQNWNTKIAFEKHQNNIKLLIRRNESSVISRHELTFQASTIFLSKKQFLNQNIDDEREQNQLKKLNDDDIDVRVKKRIRKKSFKKNFIVFICRWILKSNVSNMQFFSIDFCFLFEINSNWSNWRWLYKFAKKNSINCFIRNVCCSIFSSMLSMIVNWTISIEYVKINNNCELIFIKTSWIA